MDPAVDRGQEQVHDQCGPPADGRPLRDKSDRTRRRTVLIGRAHDCECHPKGEPVEQRQQRVLDPNRHGVAVVEVPQQRCAEGEHAEEGELHPHRALHAQAARQTTCENRVERQREVERHLNAEAPGNPDAADQGVERIPAEEEVVPPPVVGEDAGQTRIDREQGECEPIRGDDPQGSAAQISPERRLRHAVHLRVDKRPRAASIRRVPAAQ
jgi:hypothetical protein